MKDHYDVVVIGSGYGGSIAACRLARAGRAVCLLERGEERQPGSYPNSGPRLLEDVQFDSPLVHAGPNTALFDLRYNKDINVVVGCGLGGTSLINAGICLRPDPNTFSTDSWPTEFRRNAVLDSFFVHAEDMLKPSVAPRIYLDAAKSVALGKAAKRLGKTALPLPVLINFQPLTNDTNHVGVTQFPCVGCGDCVTGCNYRAKNTLIMNYLPDARNHSAEIFVRARVHYLDKAEEGGWRVYGECADERGNGTAFKVSGKIVILAAGTLGSTEILLRSRENGLQISAQIGNHFSTNGDMMGFAYNTDHIINGIGLGARLPDPNSPVGPTATAMVAWRDGCGADRMLLSEGAIPGALSDFLAPLLAIAARLQGSHAGRDVLDALKKEYLEIQSKLLGAYTGAVRNTLALIVLTHDDSMGRMSLIQDRLRIDWPGLGKQAQFEKASELMRRTTLALGGDYIRNPTWNELTDHNLATAHPLGGCVMADNADRGVVNHRGQVFIGGPGGGVHEGLYVMDGSVVPAALGVNPLLTISALAERSCYHLAQDYSWAIEY
jgi:cholesterol oxidase